MNESGKELEYYERDLEIQERFVEINVDQRLLTKWHCLAKGLVLRKGAEKNRKKCALLTNLYFGKVLFQ